MVDAVFYHKGIQQAYFFGCRYARLDFVPGSAGEKITFGPPAIADHWPSLKPIGFGNVDAILPIDRSQDEGYYFFGARLPASSSSHPQTTTPSSMVPRSLRRS
jgi:hypothetical protein